VSSKESGAQTGFRAQEPVKGNADGKQRRLGVFGQLQLTLWSIKAEAFQIETQSIVGLFERLPDNGKVIGKFLTHPGIL
jgi:hypothetical protein